MSSYYKEIVLFCSAILVRLAFHLYSGFTADDAFITFRYAENLAAGNGLVYNVGQQVLGISTPLFALLLAALASMGLKPIIAALIISLASSGITAIVVYKLARHLGFERFAWVPALLYILWPRSISAESCGMETAFFTTLVTSAIYLCRTSRYTWATLLASLAAITRPEGCFALFIVIAAMLYKERRLPLQTLLPPALIISPWLIWSKLYYGSVIPHSVPAKLALYSRLGDESWWSHLVYLMAWHNPFGWVLTVLVVSGAIYLVRKHHTGILEIGWSFGLILFFVWTPSLLFFWYIAPIYPVFLILASSTLLIPNFPDFQKTPRMKVVPILGTALLIIVMLSACYHTATSYKADQEILDNVHKAIGEYLHKHAGRDDLVAAEDIGYMGYYSRRRILDRDGLVSPEAVEYNRRGEYGKIIESSRPQWVVAGVGSPTAPFIADSSFLRNYSLSASFFSHPLRYSVFRLIEQDVE